MYKIKKCNPRIARSGIPCSAAVRFLNYIAAYQLVVVVRGQLFFMLRSYSSFINFIFRIPSQIKSRISQKGAQKLSTPPSRKNGRFVIKLFKLFSMVILGSLIISTLVLFIAYWQGANFLCYYLVLKNILSGENSQNFFKKLHQ